MKIAPGSLISNYRTYTLEDVNEGGTHVKYVRVPHGTLMFVTTVYIVESLVSLFVIYAGEMLQTRIHKDNQVFDILL
jgi:hypothetical protein